MVQRLAWAAQRNAITPPCQPPLKHLKSCCAKGLGKQLLVFDHLLIHVNVCCLSASGLESHPTLLRSHVTCVSSCVEADKWKKRQRRKGVRHAVKDRELNPWHSQHLRGDFKENIPLTFICIPLQFLTLSSSHSLNRCTNRSGNSLSRSTILHSFWLRIGMFQTMS